MRVHVFCPVGAVRRVRDAPLPSESPALFRTAIVGHIDGVSVPETGDDSDFDRCSAQIGRRVEMAAVSTASAAGIGVIVLCGVFAESMADALTIPGFVPAGAFTGEFQPALAVE